MSVNTTQCAQHITRAQVPREPVAYQGYKMEQQSDVLFWDSDVIIQLFSEK